MRRYILPILLVAGIGFAGYSWYDSAQFQQALMTPRTPGQTTGLRTITIEKGSSLSTIASQLEAQQVIMQAGTFIRYVKNQGLEKNLAAGTFTVHGGLTIPEITDILIGKTVPDRQRITIPEGYTIRDVIALTEKQGLFTEDDWETCAKACDFSAFTFLPTPSSSDPYPWSYLEGYLFPDTYFVAMTDLSVQQFVSQMLRNFETKVIKGLSEEIATSERTLHDLVVMASIVEEESTPRDDQAVVAGILWKRIDQGVQIAADATNRYIKDDPLAPITIQELRSSSPYNTRRQKGLPPTAICSPGLASFRATISPKTTPYWYYLHDTNGQIRFAETEAAHNQNKALYLQ